MDTRRRPPLELPPSDDRRLWDVWLSYYHLPTLTAADELGLFALLEKAPLTADQLARELKLSARAAEALVGIVAALGFLVQHGGRFHLTQTARHFLLPSSPTYWGGMLRQARAIPVSHEAILSALRKDRPRGGTMEEMWDEHEMEPEKARAFTAAMHSRSFHLGVAAARRVPAFASVRRLLDVAGGSGCFSIALAQEHPQIHCTVLELKQVAELARGYIAEHGVQDRVDTLAAHMFRDPWPGGYDAAFLSNIYHDWDRPECLHLTRRAFEALPQGGWIFIHELLLADTKDAPLAGITDSMVMMFFTEGKQRTLGEFESILTEGGFRDVSVIPTY
ncbi:MAG TPA: methyltransferase, partial [Planctomycetota bacterium]|nr:methyltransferase [Planctomycetota bacterium]